MVAEFLRIKNCKMMLLADNGKKYEKKSSICAFTIIKKDPYYKRRKKFIFMKRKFSHVKKTCKATNRAHCKLDGPVRILLIMLHIQQENQLHSFVCTTRVVRSWSRSRCALSFWPPSSSILAPSSLLSNSSAVAPFLPPPTSSPLRVRWPRGYTG